MAEDATATKVSSNVNGNIQRPAEVLCSTSTSCAIYLTSQVI
jgi:hypothetical protein